MILVDGGGMLALAIEQRLRSQGSEAAHVRLGEGLTEPQVARALGAAKVLVLASDDDFGNVDFALQVRRLYPS